MGTKSYTIGDLARLSGQSVRRIRFYSDKGLLPPSHRSASNYRFYTEVDLAKLDLIRALREAGVELAVISRLLRHRLSLHEVLQARLEVIETEITARRRTAAVLRATLRIPNPLEEDLRRIWTMSKISNQEMRSLVGRFVDRIATDAVMDETWRQRMVETSVPELPEDPTLEQISAWDELATMLADESFARELQEETRSFWTDALDPAAYQATSLEIYEAATQSVEAGLPPDSPGGQAVARLWLERSAQAMGRKPDAAFVAWHTAQYERNFGRIGRYRELLAALRGQVITQAETRAWTWLNEAMKALVETDQPFSITAP